MLSWQQGNANLKDKRVLYIERKKGEKKFTLEEKRKKKKKTPNGLARSHPTVRAASGILLLFLVLSLYLIY